MSEILARVAENKEKLRPGLSADLATKPLAAMLRRETWGDHERAQFSDFELSLAEGTTSKEAYRELIANVLPVYRALETRLETLSDDPIVGQFHIDELARVPFLERDLAYFYGDEWEEAADTARLPVTDEYVERIDSVDNVRFIAHHYTRYMADLSGGFIICGALERAWGGLDGLAYYDFARIGDAVGFKNAYRQALNDLPLDVERKLDVIEEVMIAYEYNIEMGRNLAERHMVTPA